MVPERTQPRANPARGVALIATAVIVGFLLLRNWDGGIAGGSEAIDAEAGGDAAGGAGATTTTLPPTTVAARPPSEVTIRVLNATDVVGAAGSQSEILQQNGYQAVEPDDAGMTLETTKVLYAAGYEQEAAEMARAINSPPDALEAIAEPPQVDPAGANLVVLLGADLASAL